MVPFQPFMCDWLRFRYRSSCQGVGGASTLTFCSGLRTWKATGSFIDHLRTNTFGSHPSQGFFLLLLIEGELESESMWRLKYGVCPKRKHPSNVATALTTICLCTLHMSAPSGGLLAQTGHPRVHPPAVTFPPPTLQTGSWRFLHVVFSCHLRLADPPLPPKPTRQDRICPFVLRFHSFAWRFRLSNFGLLYNLDRNDVTFVPFCLKDPL